MCTPLISDILSILTVLEEHKMFRQTPESNQHCQFKLYFLYNNCIGMYRFSLSKHKAFIGGITLTALKLYKR